MMPGLGRQNPRQMRQMMKRMGMNIDEMEDVLEVIIRKSGEDLVILEPSVTIMDVKGQRTYQIMGDVKVVQRSASEGSEEEAGEPEDTGPRIPPEDIALVAQQAGVSEDVALEALRNADGNPAEAIMTLLNG